MPRRMAAESTIKNNITRLSRGKGRRRKPTPKTKDQQRRSSMRTPPAALSIQQRPLGTLPLPPRTRTKLLAPEHGTIPALALANLFGGHRCRRVHFLSPAVIRVVLVPIRCNAKFPRFEFPPPHPTLAAATAATPPPLQSPKLQRTRRAKAVKKWRRHHQRCTTTATVPYGDSGKF